MLKTNSAIRNRGPRRSISERGGNSQSTILWILFVATLVVAVYIFGLTIPLVGPDEPRYAQVAREMFERGDWITPTLGGHTWFEKPALLYWLQIAAYHIFGVGEFAARIGSALFGLGTVASLYIFGRIVERRDGQVGVANWIALCSATSIGLLVFSRGASFDIILTFPLTAAMVSFFAFDQKDDRNPYLPLALFYFSVGVAVLAKGLIGGVFPLASVALFYLVSQKPPPRRFLVSLMWGSLIAFGVAALWYVPMYLRHGYEFVDEFFIQHHFQRFASNKYSHPHPFYFFLWVLPLMTLPWLPLLVASVVTDIRTRVASAPKTLAYAWLLVPLVFFSFSGSKLPGYILPALPCAMVLVGIYAYDLSKRTRVWARINAAAALVMLAGALIGLVTVVPQFAEADSVKGLFAAAERKGYTNTRVVALHHFSHNAEFYAAGRILRDDAGAQKLLYGPSEVAIEAAASDDGQILVLVPLEYLPQLMNFSPLRTEFIAENSETALVAAKRSN